VMMFRPQYGLPILGLLLLGRHFRAVGAAVASGGLIGLANTVVFGLGWISDWLSAASSFVSGDGTERASFLASPYGFFQSIFGVDSSLATIAAILVFVAATGVMAWLWWDHRAPLDVLVATTAPGLVLVSMHSAVYDTSLLLFPVLVLINRGWSKAKLIPALLAVGMIRPIYDPGFSTVAPVIMVLFVIMTGIALSERRTPTPPPSRFCESKVLL